MIQVATQPKVQASEALTVAENDALVAYRNLTPYVIRVALEADGWHIDYELNKLGVAGGGPHYIIDAASGAIVSKRYEQ